jgi:hypothetical protein
MVQRTRNEHRLSQRHTSPLSRSGCASKCASWHDPDPKSFVLRTRSKRLRCFSRDAMQPRSSCDRDPMWTGELHGTGVGVGAGAGAVGASTAQVGSSAYVCSPLETSLTAVPRLALDSRVVALYKKVWHPCLRKIRYPDHIGIPAVVRHGDTVQHWDASGRRRGHQGTERWRWRCGCPSWLVPGTERDGVRQAFQFMTESFGSLTWVIYNKCHATIHRCWMNVRVQRCWR